MEKINFQNYPNTTTPINSTNLNQIQTNIENEINTLIETGSSGNNYYIKFSNGTLICYGSGVGVDDSYGSSTFAYEFIEAPKVTVTILHNDLNFQTTAKLYEVTTTGIKVVVFYTQVNTSGAKTNIGANPYNYIAIGKWK